MLLKMRPYPELVLDAMLFKNKYEVSMPADKVENSSRDIQGLVFEKDVISFSNTTISNSLKFRLRIEEVLFSMQIH